MATESPLPDYQPMLGAYHAAFADELRAMIAALPIEPGGRVLDMACGDGAYSPWLAAKVGPAGLVVAADASTAYLEHARGHHGGGRIGHVAAALERLPFADGTFDGVWCAQSLYSLPDPLAAVRRMAAAARPGGLVAVLEDDSIHRLILPWPADLELKIRAAELAAFRAESDRPGKYYVGRRLRRVFEQAGLVDCGLRTWAVDRQAPLDEATRTFLAEHLRDIRDRVAPRLDAEDRRAVDRLVGTDSPDHILDRPDLTVTVVDHVSWGFRPR